MKFSISTKTLAAELMLLDKIVDPKRPQPWMQYILFESQNGVLTMTTTDSEVALRVNCRANITTDGKLLLPSAKLLSIVNQLVPDSDVEIEQRGAHVFLNAGMFKSRIQTMNANDFMQIADVEGEISTGPLSVLQALIVRTRYAIAEKATKFTVDGAQLTVIGDTGHIWMVTTGQKSLSVTSAGWTEGKFSYEKNRLVMIIPTKTLDALAAFDGLGDVQISHSDNRLFFVMGDRTLISHTFDVKYPSFQLILKKTDDNRDIVKVDRMAMASVLRRVGVMSEDNLSVSLKTQQDMLSISTRSADMGDAEEEFAVAYDGPEIEVKTNWKHLLDFLETARNETVDIALKPTEMQAIRLTDGPDFFNVISTSTR